MNSIFGVIAVTLGVLFLWGLFAPKSFWRVLSGWSVADTYRNEPGAGTYGLRRLVAGIGVLGLAAVVTMNVVGYVKSIPPPATPPSDVTIMWGEPNPHVVNRDVAGVSAPPDGLVAVPIIGYQAFGSSGAPSYLSRLGDFTYLGKSAIAGYIGRDPDAGFAAVDSANMLVNVRGPLLCIPRVAVVTESDTLIQIGIFYGLPDPADGSPVDNATSCALGSTVTASVLIPIELSAPVGDRVVQALEGTELQDVHLPDSSDSK